MVGSVRVLHVDDEPDFADLTAQFLEREAEQIDVVTETNPSDGLDRLTDEEFDCIVSDYQMPGMDGIEFLEAVREEYPDLPFVLFTGRGSEEVASDAITAGATDYLQKGGGTERYELLANRALNAVEQYRATRRAAELDRVRTLASDINQALIRAESRDGIETRVCEIISDSDPYLFAWIGDVDPDTDRITPRASAGIEDGYLEEITVTADDTPTGQGPGGTAIRERRIAVSQNVVEDPEFEPWREEALERGYRAVAAVPLEYGETLFGELVVYADRPEAFDADERELLGELGDDIAHALHSFDVRNRLRAERDRRQALFGNAPTPVIAGEIHEDGGHRIADVNDAFADAFGYDAAEIIGTDVADVVVPDDGMDRHEEFRKRATAGETTIAEVERTTVEGPRDFLLTIIPYGTDDGNAEGWYAWYTDISERKERERAIEELHTTTDALMEATTSEAVAEITANAVRDILNMPANGVHLYDESVDGLVPVAWTERTEAIVGEPPTFASGEGIAGTAFETGEPRIYDDISAVPERFNPDTDVRSQIVLPLDDHGVLVIGSPEPEAFDDTDVSLAETLAGHATAALDRVEREDELTRRQELFEAILETSIDGILVVDENREYVTWNQQFIDMWEIPEELVGDTPEKEGLEYVLDGLERPREFIDKVEYLYEHPHEESRDEIYLTDGRVFDRYSAPVERDDGSYYGRVWFFRDITGRKELEAELREKSNLLDEIFAQVPTHLYVKDTEGRHLHVSDYYNDSEEFVGKTDREIYPGPLGEETYEDDMQVIETDEPIINKEEYHPEDDTWTLTSKVPWYDDDGDIRGLIGVTRDITERKEYERELGRQNERLDEFASVVSHDLRNPLNVAEGRLELAQEECDSEHLDAIADAHDRMETLIDDLLTLARQGEWVDETAGVDLAETTENCWENVATAEATLVTGTDRTIRADPERLQQLLENLFRNGVEHGGQDVTITVGDLDDGSGFYVEDDGPGIPEDERDDVFKSGYSTTEDGTGFGLAIVEQIVEAHGWEISVTDSGDRGARFEITGVGFAE